MVPSANAAWPASAFPTTCALVSKKPSSVKTTADPAPAAILPSRRRWETCTAATRGVSCSATETTTWEYASSGVRSGSDERVRVSAIESSWLITVLQDYLYRDSEISVTRGRPEISLRARYPVRRSRFWSGPWRLSCGFELQIGILVNAPEGRKSRSTERPRVVLHPRALFPRMPAEIGRTVRIRRSDTGATPVRELVRR